MENVPTCFLLLVPPTPRIMVSITINKNIPNRLKHLDKQGFGKRNPDIINDKIATMEVFDIEVSGLANRLRVFDESPEQDGSRRGIQAKGSLPSASRNCLAHIDRGIELSIKIAIDDGAIRRIVPDVIDGVKPGTDEPLRWWKRADLLAKHRVGDADPEIDFVQGVIRGLGLQSGCPPRRE